MRPRRWGNGDCSEMKGDEFRHIFPPNPYGVKRPNTRRYRLALDPTAHLKRVWRANSHASPFDLGVFGRKQTAPKTFYSPAFITSVYFYRWRIRSSFVWTFQWTRFQQVGFFVCGECKGHYYQVFIYDADFSLPRSIQSVFLIPISVYYIHKVIYSHQISSFYQTKNKKSFGHMFNLSLWCCETFSLVKCKLFANCSGFRWEGINNTQFQP